MQLSGNYQATSQAVAYCPSSAPAAWVHFVTTVVGAFRRNARVLAGMDASARRPYHSLMHPWSPGRARDKVG